MSAVLVTGSIDTSYGPLHLAVVVGDHTPVSALANASTVDGPAAPSEPVVVASGWTDLAELLSRVDPVVAALPTDDAALPAPIVAAVRSWDSGDATALDAIAVVQPGAQFRQRVWTELRTVPAGRVVTYGELAALAGNPKAARAAGSACATNVVAPFVPCHRVVQAGGRVGHYAYGSDLKSRMLATERAAI